MAIIKKYKEFLLKEASEFNFMRLNPDSASWPFPNVDNPGLSTNAFDKHIDAIRSGTEKINNIIASLANTSSFQQLKSKISLEDQKIQSLKILRIVKLNTVNYTAYISFVIQEEEYWGQIENLLSKTPEVKSEVFKDYNLVQAKEWIIKTKGLLIKAIKKWLIPDDGEYELINEEAYCISNYTGKMLKLEKGSKIKVLRSFENKILIEYMDQYFTLSGDNYVWFNYWFVKTDQTSA